MSANGALETTDGRVCGLLFFVSFFSSQEEKKERHQSPAEKEAAEKAAQAKADEESGKAKNGENVLEGSGRRIDENGNEIAESKPQMSLDEVNNKIAELENKLKNGVTLAAGNGTASDAYLSPEQAAGRNISQMQAELANLQETKSSMMAGDSYKTQPTQEQAKEIADSIKNDTKDGTDRKIAQLREQGVDTTLLDQVRSDYKKGLIGGDLSKMYDYLKAGTDLMKYGYEQETQAQRDQINEYGSVKNRTNEYKAYLYGMEMINDLAPGKVLMNADGAMRYRSGVDMNSITPVAGREVIANIPWTNSGNPMHSNQLGQGDFMAPLGTPVSVLEPTANQFRVTGVATDPNGQGGLMVTVDYQYDGDTKTLTYGHLQGQLPDYILNNYNQETKKFTPITVSRGTVIGYVGLTGNHAIGANGTFTSAPNSHSHITFGGSRNTTMIYPWQRRATGYNN